MYLLCKNNEKFEETGKLIQAAHDLDVIVRDIQKLEIGWPTPYFTFGTRPFCIENVQYGDIFSKQEYIYEYSFILSSKLTSYQLLNYFCDIIPAKKVSEYVSMSNKNSFFMRPVSGDKQFNGQVFHRATLQNNIPQFLQINPWELVVIAPDKGPIDKEYRFFVVKNNKEEVRYECCEYLPEHSNTVPVYVKSFAQKMIEKIFDSIPFGNSFVLDICEIGGALFVLELNSINSSSYYSISPHSLLKLIGF